MLQWVVPCRSQRTLRHPTRQSPGTSTGLGTKIEPDLGTGWHQ